MIGEYTIIWKVDTGRGDRGLRRSGADRASGAQPIRAVCAPEGVGRWWRRGSEPAAHGHAVGMRHRTELLPDDAMVQGRRPPSAVHLRGDDDLPRVPPEQGVMASLGPMPSSGLSAVQHMVQALVGAALDAIAPDGCSTTQMTPIAADGRWRRSIGEIAALGTPRDQAAGLHDGPPGLGPSWERTMMERRFGGALSDAGQALQGVDQLLESGRIEHARKALRGRAVYWRGELLSGAADP